MDASEILDGQMSLEDKLAAIDEAMKTAEAAHQKANPGAAPLDPADLTICDGCE